MENTNNVEFKVKDFVNYRNNGICQIESVSEHDFGMGKKLYYIMHSVFEEDTKIRVPVDSKVVKTNMKRLLSKEEINEIIDETESSSNVWIDDYKKRATEFEEIINKGNRADILWIIKQLSLYREDAKLKKRKFGVTDEKILEKANKTVIQEFAFILNIKQEEVVDYIEKRLEKNKK